jgi:hypothetical protein
MGKPLSTITTADPTCVRIRMALEPTAEPRDRLTIVALFALLLAFLMALAWAERERGEAVAEAKCAPDARPDRQGQRRYS